MHAIASLSPAVAAAVALALSVTCGPAKGQGPEPSASVDDLRWLAGCWSYVGKEAGSGEQWTAPAGGTLLGTARTVRQGKTVSWEFLMIRETADGAIDYVAAPSGQASTAFRLAEASEGLLVFANPEHDFPQRVVYELRPDGGLAARIEGEIGGQERRVDFPMERTSCPDAEPPVPKAPDPEP